MANKPNNPSLWSKAKSLAKQKFDVYPSAYANGWAAKWYKSKGGTWRKAEYGMEVPYMTDGGEKMPPDIARARFAAAGNLDKLEDYGYAYGGYTPEMAAGGWAQQAAIAIAMKKAGKKPKNDNLPKAPFGMFLLPGIMNKANKAMDTLKSNPELLNLIAPGGGSMAGMMQDGGEPDGEMALGQIAAVVDKMDKLRQFIQPDSDLEPWVSSKLSVMDHYADAVSDYMTYNPEAQGEMMDESQGLPMEEMRDGGIPTRYKNMGFTKVGVKKNSTRPGKKWMVLAKKGNDYKVVHGGYDGMKDFSQHGSEKRKEKFWNRMGGKNSSKATDPFSPLYWHKRFGTWEEGGEIGIPEMKGGGSTWSGNAWYANGGNTLNNTNMFTYPFLPMAQGGYEAPPRQEDYPDYNSYAAAMDNWMAGLNYMPEQPIEQDTPGGIPRPLPVELQQQSVSSMPAPQSAPKIDYKGVSVVDLLNSVGAPSDYNSRKSLAVELGITNYIGSAEQNSKIIKMVMSNPTVLDEYKKAIVNTKHKSQTRTRSSAATNAPAKSSSAEQSAPRRTNQSQRAEAANARAAQEAMQEAAMLAVNPMSQFSTDGSKFLVRKDLMTGRFVPNLVGQGLMDARNAERIKLAEQMNMAEAVKKSGQPYFSQSRNYEMGGFPYYDFGGAFAYGGYLPEQYAEGGINIQPANKGKFTAKAKGAGMSVQEFANKVLNAPEGNYSPSLRRQANFARNASKWKKAEGGPVEGDVLDVTPEELQMLKAGGYTFEIID